MKNKVILLTVTMITAFALIVGFTFFNNDPDKKSPGLKGTSGNPIVIKGQIMDNPLVLLNESFESTTFPPAGWVKITPTGGTGWYRVLGGLTPVPGFNGGTIICPPGGGTAVAFCNYVTGGTSSCDQWLISPKIGPVIPGDSISFWLRKFGNYLDNFWVRLSTTTPTVAGMTTVVWSVTHPAADSGYVFKTFQIGTLATGSSVYVGFREWVLDAVNDGASYSLDLVKSTANITGVTHNENIVPDKYSISQNYPNPFNPTTKIDFAIPKSGFVSIKVYDMLGKEVAQLVNEDYNAGSYTIHFTANKLTSGTYFYKIQAGDFTAVKSMILVK
jgi:hypothetical protein